MAWDTTDTLRKGDVVSNESLANLLREERRFPPPADLAANANVTAEAYEQAKADRLGFWAEQARRLTWAKEPTETLDWSNPPFAKWFKDGALNVAYNCVDRHVEAGHGDRVAIHFEGGSPATAGPSPTPSSRTRSPRRPTPSSNSACAPATGSRSTCR